MYRWHWEYLRCYGKQPPVEAGAFAVKTGSANLATKTFAPVVEFFYYVGFKPQTIKDVCFCFQGMASFVWMDGSGEIIYQF